MGLIKVKVKYDNSNSKHRRGEMKVYPYRALMLYVKWYNLI